ncbi:GTPase Era [Treponema sp.]|uniref:GTPase Era n=1 Tax=Treponema sp. TaxID=166 RepID=UPI003F070752
MNNDEKNSSAETQPTGSKTALVSIVGRPSAGKSTFLNTASGEKVSIVSPVPQTTRNAIRGIINTSLGQLVFIDTPGLHLSEKKLNLRLSGIAQENIKESDAILYIIDSTRPHSDEEKMIASLLLPYKDRLVIAVNKIEDSKAKPELSFQFIQEQFPDIPSERVIGISAKEDKNIDAVLKSLFSLAKDEPHLYPEEFYTDQEVEFRISEIIRGQAINRLEQELPHAVYVGISDMEMKTPKLLKVLAFIYVERESQKGIVIGKNASMIKTIRIESIKECRKIFPYKVDIDLRVKVDKNWRQKDKVLDKIIK